MPAVADAKRLRCFLIFEDLLLTRKYLNATNKVKCCEPLGRYLNFLTNSYGFCRPTNVVSSSSCRLLVNSPVNAILLIKSQTFFRQVSSLKFIAMNVLSLCQ